MNNLSLADEKTKIQVRGLDFFYGTQRSLKSVDMIIPEKRITAIIGPSGCGKSTLLRVFNRIYSMYPKQEAKGEVMLNGENILAPGYSMNRLRSNVGMVF
jgi:phosphate transport system ATP-binding protein